MGYISLLGDIDDVRTYGYKAARVAALIYTHFRKEFGEYRKPSARN